MSNSSPATYSTTTHTKRTTPVVGHTPMAVTRLQLTGEGAWPDLTAEPLSSQLNVFYGPPRTGKSSLAQLIGHLLYGRLDSPWRRQFAQTVSTTTGSLELSGPRGNFRLRRQRDDRPAAQPQWRLTIASDQGDAASSDTIEQLLAGLSPSLAAQVFFVDFAESPRAARLLSENFARELTGLKSSETTLRVNHQSTCCGATANTPAAGIDRRRVDELVKRRDAIAGDLEQRMAVGRRESETLQQELTEVDNTLTARRERLAQLQTQLRRVASKQAELEVELRYNALDHHPTGQPLDVEQHQQDLAELDQEIARCRQTVAELGQRENFLRTELAQWGSDGTADSVTCLAEGRVTLGTLEQLLDELDAEVSQLARASEPGRCIGHDSHAKLTPVAALLRQQVYTLCGQLTEQERSMRRQQLTAESRQLARVHGELGSRLDLLLSRRESLLQQAQLQSQPTRFSPQPPAAPHCQCEHHGEFIQLESNRILGRANRGQHQPAARSELHHLQTQRQELTEELGRVQLEIEALSQRWERLQHERASLIGNASIEQMQAELERLESVIHQSLSTTEKQVWQIPSRHWRASDILSQLTGGQLVQIRLQRDRHQTLLIDRDGKHHTLDSLPPAQHDQLYLALTLSLASSYARRGIHLPLVLDEPFLQQNSAQAAVMAGVLDEFARAGHQLFVFTEDREAFQRCSTLNATLFNIEALRSTQPVAPPSPTTHHPPLTTPTISTRIIRETNDGYTAPVLRLATMEGSTDQDDIFYLTENSTFHDFPVLGAETERQLGQLSIHSIGDLLSADSGEIARQLGRTGITAETVRLWQIHTALMCHIPNLPLDDAQVLAAVGIDSPDDLFDADIESLLQSIDSFLRSERGRRFERHRERYTTSRLSGWRSGSRRYRDRWQRSSRRYSDWRLSRGSSSRNNWASSSAPSGQRGQRQANNPRSRSTTRSRGSSSGRRPSRQHRFYLSREQDVEAAPSIGPKTATRLAKVGVRTVADLLHADPDSTATELDQNHITAETIAAWQHQARLVCQIPQLRGYGAQLLVACGLTQPEQIAAISADTLVAQVLSFCQTKEGQRILRSGDAPKHEKIAEWVELAAHSRPLEAA